MDLFDSEVEPKMQAEKTAYVWVDALRFEMARELTEVLEGRFRPEPSTCHRQRCPRSPRSAWPRCCPRPVSRRRSCRSATASSAVEIAGTVIKDRKDRINFIKAHAGVPVFD